MTSKLVIASDVTADQAMAAEKETTHKATTEDTVQKVAASTAPTAILGWTSMPKYDCRACHAIDHKLVGSAWKDVAQKSDPNAETMPMQKVKKGSNGNWNRITGGMVMPPHPALSDADLKKAVDFVLSLSK